MKHRFIKDLKEGEVVEAVYLIRQKSFNEAKNGSNYISLELADKTGIIKGNKWDASRGLFESFQVDDFIKVTSKIEIYKNYLQLNLNDIQKADDAGIDMSYYMPTADKDRNQMFYSLMRGFDTLTNPYLKLLIGSIFTNDNIKNSFKDAPAATDFHHAYIGGLLEHTLSCMELAVFVSGKYPNINRDILLCGTVLHDIGKIEELSYKRSFYYTDRGRLLGHLVLGANLVDSEIARIPGFPDELRNLLLHMILSHHGEYEWGSPKRPMCIEAVILHNIDNLDAKTNGFQYFVGTYNDDASKWTKYSKMFGEMLYKKVVSKIL